MLEDLYYNTREFLRRKVLPLGLAFTMPFLSLACGKPSKNYIPPKDQGIEQIETGRKVEGLERKVAETDSEGRVSFTDNSSDENVNITVLDKNSGNPIPNLNVIYDDGDNFEVFTVIDPSGIYLPSRGFFSHNSEHVLRTIEGNRTKNGYETIQIIQADDSETLQAFREWHSLLSNNWSGIKYVKTIRADEAIDFTKGKANLLSLSLEGMILIFSLGTGVMTLPAITQLSDQVENFPEFSKHSRWDVLEISSGLTPYPETIIVPSNMPSANITGIEVFNDDLIHGRVTWIGTDALKYEGIAGLPTQRDLTIALNPEGDPNKSDLTFDYQIKLDGELIYEGRTDQTSVNLEYSDMMKSEAFAEWLDSDTLESYLGSWDIKVTVKDEANNESTATWTGDFKYPIDVATASPLPHSPTQFKDDIPEQMSKYFSGKRIKVPDGLEVKRLDNGNIELSSKSTVWGQDYGNANKFYFTFDDRGNTTSTLDPNNGIAEIWLYDDAVERESKERSLVYIFVDRDFVLKNRGNWGVKGSRYWNPDPMQYHQVCDDLGIIPGVYVGIAEFRRNVWKEYFATHSNVDSIREVEVR